MNALIRSTLVTATALAVLSTAACGTVNNPTSSSTAASGAGTGGRAVAEGVRADPAVEALVPAALKQRGVMQIVTDPTYAPVEFTDGSGNIIGLEPDMAIAAAAKMGLKVTFNKGDFNGIIAGIQAHRYDGSWAAFTVTSDREKQVNMVSYQNAGTSVMVKHGNPSNINQITDLCGKTVAAQTGNTATLIEIPSFQKKCAHAGKPAIKPLVLPQQDNVNQAVETGRADAMVADGALVAYYAQRQPDIFQSVNTILVDVAPEAVIVPKDNTALAAAFKSAIDALIADGTYAKILKAWNLSVDAITAARINPVGQ